MAEADDEPPGGPGVEDKPAPATGPRAILFWHLLKLAWEGSEALGTAIDLRKKPSGLSIAFGTGASTRSATNRFRARRRSVRTAIRNSPTHRAGSSVALVSVYRAPRFHRSPGVTERPEVGHGACASVGAGAPDRRRRVLPLPLLTGRGDAARRWPRCGGHSAADGVPGADSEALRARDRADDRPGGDRLHERKPAAPRHDVRGVHPRAHRSDRRARDTVQRAGPVVGPARARGPDGGVRGRSVGLVPRCGASGDFQPMAAWRSQTRGSRHR